MTVSLRLQVCSIVVFIASYTSSFHHNSLKPRYQLGPSIFQPPFNKNHQYDGILLRSSTLEPEAAQVYGITASGEPCKRCQKLGEFCWQHKWQETDKSSENSMGIFSDSKTTLALCLSSCAKRKACVYAIMGLLTVLTTMSLAFRNYVPRSSVTQSIKTVSTQVLKQHNVTASILRLLPLGAFAFGLAFLKFLMGRRVDTVDLLRTVDSTVQKVRYVGDLPSFQTPLSRFEPEPVASSSTGSRQAMKVPTRQKIFYGRPASQLMARNNDDSDSESMDKNNDTGDFTTMDAIKGAIPLLVLVVLASKFETFLHLSQVLKANVNPTYIRDTMVPILDRLNGAGTKGQVIYTLSLVLWTMTVGVTTPIETAAGIAFGTKKGIVCNALGKTGGAVLSFVLGRYFLYKYVRSKLKDNELLGLVEESIEENPLGVSLMMRFAPLPEFAKNFGLSILKVPARWFAVAVLLHGVPFTCLWTSVGAETASVMRGGAPSATLKILMTGVAWFGLISPTVIGLWINSLRKKRIEREEGNAA
ncbi:unnamed protein product [Cylindrotheca closterium]|uniref:VTT domain-containing protein n=1 Tax=Cylindrotheca closterium TaxID=2856 RepID=A0AAD2GA22_9STRA|nr:unnamed protein product [Cylindrotheca closterium]